jgi:tetratricopeptide (TPR) repeat protein
MTSAPGAERATAVLRLSRASGKDDEVRPLDPEREYVLKVELDGREVASGPFQSPLGDVRWRSVMDAMSKACSQQEESRHYFNPVFAAGAELHRAVVGLSPDLGDFLARDTGPRRLVIASDCAEMHFLPWEALVSERKAPLAEGDLSIVRARRHGFDGVRQVSGEELRLSHLIGPETGRTTLPAIPDDEGASDGGRRRGLRAAPIRTSDGRSLREAFAASTAEIVHVEAHGDNLRPLLDLERGTATSLAAAAEMIGQHPRLLVLFWTCFSGMTHASGDSLGRLLHGRDTNLVLGFATPLRFEDAGLLAERFYAEVLDPRTGGDVESVLVGLRRLQAKSARLRCLWASLTVWLRRPLDLTPALRDGPRLPEDAWVAGAGRREELALLLSDPVPGRYTVRAPMEVPPALAPELVRNTRGAAIRLHGAIDAVPHLDAILEACRPAVKSPSRHPADRLRALLRGLADYRESILLWSDVSPAELTFFELCDDLPANLAVVLVERAPEPGAPPPEEPLEKLDRLIRRGDLADAVGLWTSLGDQVDRWRAESPASLLRFLSAGYWATVKTNGWDEAEACVGRLGEEARRDDDHAHAFAFEASLLRGNFEERVSHYDLARRAYFSAQELANAADNARDQGRVLMELGYLEAQLGDRLLAERLYRDALRRLESWDETHDPVWRSALGRALRDQATLLAPRPERTAEARGLLRRAAAIHALDGRFEQLAPTLRTRGLVEETEGRLDLAEASLRSAAARCASFGNSVGCVDGLRELARLACARGRLEQSLAILDGVTQHLATQPEERDRHRSQVAAQRAHVLVALGRNDEALAACTFADESLPPSLARERAPLRDLRDVIRFLHGEPLPLRRGDDP